MIRFKPFLKACDVRRFSAADITLPSLPKDADSLNKGMVKPNPGMKAAFPRSAHFTETLEITSHNSASGPLLLGQLHPLHHLEW
jgi:hypothetical protein